jgi:hypothetical protein
MTTNAIMDVTIKSWFWPSGETTNSKPHGPIIMINNHKLKKTIRSYLLHFSLTTT